MNHRCSVAGCTRDDYYARGYCKLHYTRWLNHGDPTTYKFLGIEEKLWNGLKKSAADECWLWQGGTNGNGYGHVSGRWKGKYRAWLVHRLSYEIAYGPIPEGMCVCHRCDTPRCANPAHLFLGTQSDNHKDMENKGRARGRFSGMEKVITCGHDTYFGRGLCRKCYMRQYHTKGGSAAEVTHA
jgi:hypothetical protein